MARSGVTFEQVRAAANKLEGTGTKATVKAVRGELGTGSATTLAEHLRQWREEKESKSENELLSHFSKDLQSSIAILVNRASESLKSASSEKVEALKADLKEQHEEMTSLEGELLGTKKKLDESEKRWQFELNRHSVAIERIEELEKNLEVMREKITESRIDRAVFEKELSFKDERIKELSAELKRLRT